MEFIAVNRQQMMLPYTRVVAEMRAHSGKRESHGVKPFAFPQSEDLELILEVERGVQLFTDLDFLSVYTFIYFFL